VHDTVLQASQSTKLSSIVAATVTNDKGTRAVCQQRAEMNRLEIERELNIQRNRQRLLECGVHPSLTLLQTHHASAHDIEEASNSDYIPSEEGNTSESTTDSEDASAEETQCGMHTVSKGVSIRQSDKGQASKKRDMAEGE
jgi:hypothetical protein